MRQPASGTPGPEMGCGSSPLASGGSSKTGTVQGASALAVSDPSKLKAHPQAVRPWKRFWAKQVVSAGPLGPQCCPVDHALLPTPLP